MAIGGLETKEMGMAFAKERLETALSGNLRDPPSSRMLSTQLLIASFIGLLAIFIFAVLRNRYPHIFMARLSHLKRINNSKLEESRTNSHLAPSNPSATNIFTRSFLNISNKSFINSAITLHRITDEEIIDFAGLDAYVFLGFFKMAINLLFVCWIFAVLIISPVRYYFTGSYDQGDDEETGGPGAGHSTGILSTFLSTTDDGESPKYWFDTYLLIYVVFTYLFTYITCHFLIKHARMVINKRQKILGKQNSITDRTIRLSGIPPELRTEKVLKQTVENLHIGKVEKIVICKEWKKLDSLIKQRSKVIKNLEFYWTNYMKVESNNNTNTNSNNNNNINDSSNRIRLSEASFYHDDIPSSDIDTSPSPFAITEASAFNPQNNIFKNDCALRDDTMRHSLVDDNFDLENGSIQDSHFTLDSHQSIMSTISIKSRPKIRTGFFGIFGNKVDALDYYTNQLSVIDLEIQNARKYHYPATPTAFVTMDSVATAQTLAQAVLDPRIGYLISSTAPAPADIIWENATLSSHSRKLKIYYITVITGVLAVIFIFPVSYLATLLNYKSIKKFWPALASFLLEHEWASKLIIDLLPVYLYTLLNGMIPFLYVWLSSKQGFISHGEEELSVVSKNFFYVFVNLFLVFTMAGTASNYWGYLSDSKKLALQLAQSLRGLASFYVDTIVLQGIGLMPFKLLPIGRIFQFIYFALTHSQSGKSAGSFKLGKPTARELISLYQPPAFNFGLQLPHPLLTLVITLIYSVISTKILSAGLMYFIIGYYVYKFLLIYTYVHPQHSTGKVMPIIFRRVILGLLLFQLTVAGSLVLENSWILAVCLAPLPLATLMVLWYFQEKLKPLSIFIALRAIEVDNDVNLLDNTGSTFTTSSNSVFTDTIKNTKRPLTGNSDNHNSTSIGATGTSNVWRNNIFSNSSDSLPANKTDTSNKNGGYRSMLIRNLKTTATIDERREQNQHYDYPPLVESFDGPWIGLEATESADQNSDAWILVWTTDGINKKRITDETIHTDL